jgi:hypothetical protein
MLLTETLATLDVDIIIIIISSSSSSSSIKGCSLLRLSLPRFRSLRIWTQEYPTYKTSNW